ncbi:phage tail spike protein [Bacillus sp. TL12]|uniref:phage tail spike protein n=1 Tax=Bacillus sp. TL12 TaxID=2894756 RepID=UPI001F51EE29|nr:phage tail spike protein [Bacillus sp. TL12]MCI0767874.1 phage tail protein [Bacillus sp. TL12]
MNLVAILENAYKIGYVKETNNLWTCSFSLPLNDPKRFEVKPKYFIELYDHDKYIGKFIVNPKKTVKNESDNSITYNCEHVWSTLHSDVLFRYHQLTNWTTRDVLEYLLSKQEIKHWKLGDCHFERYFHYAWENENSLLNALVSVPKPFNESYLWTWDDTTYPFTLNLVRVTNEKVDTIRYGKNLKGIEKEEDPTGLITRIFPLGYGEGVNQLGIEKVNGGVPYLEAEFTIIDEHGIHKQIWVDRRFEDAKSLKASAQALLDKYKKPQTTVSVDCIDYELIDPYKIIKYDIAKIVGVYDQDVDTNDDLRIMKITKPDIYGDPSNIQFDLGNVREDIGTTITDLQKKQLVNDTYSQGSTNIDSRDFQDNCDPDHPAVIRFQIPNDVMNVNELLLTFETLRFRAYERAIKGGGAVVGSTSAGGSNMSTTSAGGGLVITSSAGGGIVKTSSGGGDHVHKMFHGGGIMPAEPTTIGLHTAFSDPGRNTSASIYVKGTGSSLYTHGSSGDHTHETTLPNHTHSTTVPPHSHDYSTPSHTHDMTLPNHTHEIEYGIFEFNETPSKVTITVDGNVVPFTSTSGQDIDLEPYIAKDDEGKFQRGRYVEIKITPNSLARINATVTGRLFIQSRKGGTF